MLHHQSTGSAAFAATVLGDDQHHRKPTCRSAHPHPPGDQLAEWLHGSPLDGFGLLEDGKELPQDYGLSRTLDAGGDSERIAGRHSAGSGVVISTQPPLATFNYGRDILSIVTGKVSFGRTRGVSGKMPASCIKKSSNCS